MRGPDLRIGKWIGDGYIHPQLLKSKRLLVLRTCPEDVKMILRNMNKELSYPAYVFEDEISPEDIVFWEE